ncbi:unnamed protein product [Lota lota]
MASVQPHLFKPSLIPKHKVRSNVQIDPKQLHNGDWIRTFHIGDATAEQIGQAQQEGSCSLCTTQTGRTVSPCLRTECVRAPPNCAVRINASTGHLLHTESAMAYTVSDISLTQKASIASLCRASYESS